MRHSRGTKPACGQGVRFRIEPLPHVDRSTAATARLRPASGATMMGTNLISIDGSDAPLLDRLSGS